MFGRGAALKKKRKNFKIQQLESTWREGRLQVNCFLAEAAKPEEREEEEKEKKYGRKKTKKKLPGLRENK